jgi:FAD/FMN-containing dehydrogenase
VSSDTPDSTRLVDQLAGSLPVGTVFRPGTEQYATSTSPDNSSFRQRPDAVVRPRTTDDVAAAVTLARALGLRVAVQATGHGAGSPLGDGLVLVDTSALDAVSIDPAAPARDGALTRVPGPFLLHAVGAADSDQRRADVDSYLARVEAAARPADLGRAAPSFREGQPGPADAYQESELRRLTQVAAHTDPDRVFAFERVPAPPAAPEIVLP